MSYIVDIISQFPYLKNVVSLMSFFYMWALFALLFYITFTFFTLFKLFYITQKLAKLVSQNFLTFPKINLATFI